jgi:hypothetical protein
MAWRSITGGADIDYHVVVSASSRAKRSRFRDNITITVSTGFTASRPTANSGRAARPYL